MPHTPLLQEALPDSLSAPALEPIAATGAFRIGSLLDISGQAGGFQWPLLAVLAAGLLVLAAMCAHLFFERRAALPLRSLRLPELHLGDLRRTLSESAESLYARLALGMVELAGADAGILQQEAAHLAGLSAARYQRTRRIVEFLSSTAGGLGLLGTLVGIYALFSAGARDAQTIFAGIGIAVVSTLLGIVVAIVLELLEVLTTGWARRYVQEAQEWATRLRYRLLELRRAGGAGHSLAALEDEALRVERIGTIPKRVRPGQEVGPLGVRVLRKGRPAGGESVVLSIAAGGGRFSSGEQRMQMTTTEAGVVAFTLRTGEEEGHNVVEAEVRGERVRFSVTTCRSQT